MYLCTSEKKIFKSFMAENINISAFLIGVSTAFFSIFAIHILFWRKRRTRFQTVLGCIMAVWAVWNLKDIVITFPGMYTEEVLNWILIVDGWSALTYTVFVAEVVMPGWTTGWRLMLLASPFALFTAVYGLWTDDRVLYAYLVFLWCYAWTVVGVAYVKTKRYLDYIRSNFSNIDKIDVSWLKPTFLFAILSQLSWLVTSLYATVSVDIVYYISTIMLWLVVLHYCWDFCPIVVEKKQEPMPQHKNIIPISEGALEQLVDEQQLYLNPNLTLQELAQLLASNRTYVSNYLSQVRQQTFYDYINQLRIERRSLPLMREHPEYTLEYIAKESGFASISTFRRAFVKMTGQTPTSYRQNLMPSHEDF